MELLQAARNLLHRTHENTTVPRAAIGKWLSKHYKVTILGEEIKGQWERQTKGQPIIVKLNEELANYNNMVKLCKENGAQQLIPSNADRNGNLMTIPLLTTVKYVQKRLRGAKGGAIPAIQADYTLLIRLIYDYDCRQEEQYWVNDNRREDDKRQPEKKEGDSKKTHKKSEKDPKEMAEAIKNYAREKNVKIEDVKTSQLYQDNQSVRKWAEKSDNYTAHNSAEGKACYNCGEEGHLARDCKKERTTEASNGDAKGKRCRFYAAGFCKKGDQCNHAHLERYKDRQRKVTQNHGDRDTSHHLQPDENESKLDSSSEEEMICWHIALSTDEADQDDTEEYWHGAGVTGEEQEQTETGELSEQCDSIAVIARDGQGETAEQLSMQCPWIEDDAVEDEWSSSDQDVMSWAEEETDNNTFLPLDGLGLDYNSEDEYIPWRETLDNHQHAEPWHGSGVILDGDEKEYVDGDDAHMDERDDEGKEHYERHQKMKLFRRLQREAENHWLTEGLRTSRALGAMHDWAQTHRRRNVGEKHWNHRHAQEAVEAMRRNSDLRLSRALLIAHTVHRRVDNALHSWSQAYRRKNLGWKYWQQKRKKIALSMIRNNQFEEWKAEDAESLTLIRLGEALDAVERRRLKTHMFQLRKNVIISANNAIKAMNAEFWAKTRGETRQLTRAWSQWKTHLRQENRIREAITVVNSRRGTTATKRTALKTWNGWHRRIENLKGWMSRADWTVWEYRTTQKIFYNWRIDSGIRAEGRAWMGQPPATMAWDGVGCSKPEDEWKRELIEGGIKHEYIMLQWASTWHKRWSRASNKRKRDAMNTWRLVRALNKRVSMWSKLNGDKDDDQEHDGSRGEGEDNQGDSEKGARANTAAAGSNNRPLWNGSSMYSASIWYYTMELTRALHTMRDWSSERKIARVRLERKLRRSEQKRLHKGDITEQWNEMHAGKVRLVTVRTDRNGTKTAEWAIDTEWKQKMKKMDAADELKTLLEQAERDIEAEDRATHDKNVKRKKAEANSLRESLEMAERRIEHRETYERAREQVNTWWRRAARETEERNDRLSRMRAAEGLARIARTGGPAGAMITQWRKTMEFETTVKAQREEDKWNRKFTHPRVLRSLSPDGAMTCEQSSQAERGSSEREWWESMVRNRDMPLRTGWRQSREKQRARGITPDEMHVTYRDQPNWKQLRRNHVTGTAPPMTAAPMADPEEAEGRKVTAFVGWIGGHKVVIGVDTFAEVSLISDRITSTTWKRTSTKPLRMSGLGSATMGDRVMVPVQFRAKEVTEQIEARESDIKHLPPGIDLLIGTKDQRRMKMKIDQGNDRLEIKRTRSGRGIAIDLETAKTIRRRMSAPGLKVLDLASGSSSPALILQDLGWNIDKWIACEIDGETRQVAEGLCAKVKHASHDLLKMARTKSSGRYDLLLSATPCKGFSNANDKATGMDGKDGELLRAAASIINQAMENNPKAKFLVENVSLHKRLIHQAAEQDGLFKHLGVKFKQVKASDNGSSQVRSRRIATNIVEVEEIEKKDQLDPNALLGELATAQDRDTPCIMAAGSTTRAPVIVKDMEDRRRRMAGNDEKEALQGYPVGMSRGFREDIPESKRTKVIGNAWNYHQMSAIFRHLEPRGDTARKYSMHAVRAEEIEGISKSERKLLAMTHGEREEYFAERMKGFELAKLKVTLKEEQTVPWQVPQSTRMNTPSGKREAAVAEIQLRLKRGHLKLVRYRRKQWIAAMFCKGKNRINPETQLEAIRLLTDFRKLNSASNWPKQWNEYCPTIEGIKNAIPACARWFATEDVSDAYEGAEVTADSRHLLTAAPPVPIRASMFTDAELEEWGTDPVEELREAEDLLVEWSGMPQGLAVSATFFNCHLADGLNQLMDEEWQKMWTVYVDDVLIHGQTKWHCEQRQEIFRQCMEALGKKLSEKGDRTVKEYGLVVGLKVTAEGIEPDDEVVECLLTELRTRPKSIKQLRHLIGVILYSSGAFEWTQQDLTWWAKVMKPLHEATTKERFAWTEECAQSVRELEKRVKIMPRAHCDPSSLIDDNHCLIIMADASSEGVGAGIWRVARTDASEVTIEDLQNREISTLIATDAKILTASEREWMTFEHEIYATYRAVKKWGKLLVQATINYTKDGTPKIGLKLDNTTATKKWMDMHEPTMIQHAGAKEMRILGWAERVAFIGQLPVHTSYCPGELNSFADLVSRIAHILGEIADRRKDTVEEYTAHHVDLPTFRGRAKNEDLPDGYMARHLLLNKEECNEVNRAMSEDKEKVHSVQMKDIYRCVMTPEETIPAEIRNKVEPWVGRMYFAVTHPTTGVRMMYTPMTSTRLHFEREDASKILVTCVPNGANVKMIEPEDVEKFDADGPEWMKTQHQLRGQVLLMVHDLENHPRETVTLMKARSIAHWPNMDDDVHTHYWTCANCLPDVKAITGVGRGIWSLHRFTVLQIDHYILDKEWQAACGVKEILTIVDVATGITSFEVVRNQTAKETSRVIHDRWFPYYSTPLKFISDSHPGFASEVMNEFRKIFGMRPNELAAPREKSKTGTVESRHNLLTRVLGNGFAKGDIKDAVDLQTYCQEAKAEHDFETKGEVSPFECAVGQRPRTARCMSLVCDTGECRAVPINPEHDKTLIPKPKVGSSDWQAATIPSGMEPPVTKEQQTASSLGLSEPVTLAKSNEGGAAAEMGSNSRLTARERRIKQLRRVRLTEANRCNDTAEGHCGHFHMDDEMTDEGFLQWMRRSKKAVRGVGTENHDIDVEKLNEEAIDKQIKKMGPADIAQLIEAEAERTVQMEGFRRDRRARDSILSRLRKQSKAPQAYDFHIIEGKEVSHGGKLYTVTGTTGSNGTAITARIRPSRGTGSEQWVVASELRPGATPRPVRTISSRGVKEDDFVIWIGEKDELGLRGGRVLTHTDDVKHVVVHEYEGTEDTAQVWLPLWVKTGREPIRRGKCPKGMTPKVRELSITDIEVIGGLTDTFRLTESTLRELDAKGFNNK